MAFIDGCVAVVTDVGPRVRRIVFDVPQLAELKLPGGADEAVEYDDALESIGL